MAMKEPMSITPNEYGPLLGLENPARIQRSTPNVSAKGSLSIDSRNQVDGERPATRFLVDRRLIESNGDGCGASCIY